MLPPLLLPLLLLLLLLLAHCDVRQRVQARGGLGCRSCCLALRGQGWQ
jgi:hypothetical protein